MGSSLDVKSEESRKKSGNTVDKVLGTRSTQDPMFNRIPAHI